MAKRKTRRKKSTKNNSTTIFFVVVLIIAILSFAITYLVMQSNDEAEEPVQTTEQEITQEKPVKQDVMEDITSSLQGTWASYNDGAMLTITGRDYTIELPNVEGTIVEKGKVAITKNKITFVDTDEESACSVKPGVYNYTIKDKDEVSFEKINDNCQSRSIRLQATWFRV